MKKKFLSFVVGISMCLSIAVGSVALPAKATQTTTQGASVAVIPEEKEETFENLLNDAKNFDPATLEDESYKSAYNKILNKMSEIYKERNLSYSAEELKVRANLYWMSVLEVEYYNINVFREATKYLGMSLNDMINILEVTQEDLFPDAFEMELPKIVLYDLLFDPSTLSENDKKVFDALKERVKFDSEIGDEEDIQTSTIFLWAVRDMDLAKYGKEDAIVILGSLAVTLDEYQYLKFTKVSGTPEDIVKEIYQAVLLRDADEAGLAHWVNEYNKASNNGQDVNAGKTLLMNALRAGDEFKSLQESFIKFVES